MAGSKGLRCEAPAWCPTEGPLVPGRCAWTEDEYAVEEGAAPEEAAPRGGRPPGEPTVEGRAGWSYGGTYVAREEEEERPRGSSLADVLVGGKDRPTFSNLYGGSGWGVRERGEKGAVVWVRGRRQCGKDTAQCVGVRRALCWGVGVPAAGNAPYRFRSIGDMNEEPLIVPSRVGCGDQYGAFA